MLYAGPKLENPAGVDAFDLGGGGGGGPVIDGFQLEPVATHYASTTGAQGLGFGHTFSTAGTASKWEDESGAEPTRTNFATSASPNAEARFGYMGIHAFPAVSDAAHIPGFIARFMFTLPDGSYGSGATGSRIFIFQTTEDEAWGADNTGAGVGPIRGGLGLRYSTSAGDTTWKAISKFNAATAATVADTGVTFAPGDYAIVIWSLPGSGETNWSIRKLGGASATGIFATPPIPARWGRQAIRASLVTLSAVARNIQFMSSSIALIHPGPAS